MNRKILSIIAGLAVIMGVTFIGITTNNDITVLEETPDILSFTTFMTGYLDGIPILNQLN